MNKRFINSLYANILIFLFIAFVLSLCTFTVISILSDSLSENTPNLVNVLAKDDLDITYNEFACGVLLQEEYSEKQEYIRKLPRGNSNILYSDNIYVALLNIDGEILSANCETIMIDESRNARKIGFVVSNNQLNSELIINFDITDSAEHTVLVGSDSSNMTIEAISFENVHVNEISNPQFLEYRYKRIEKTDDRGFLVAYFIRSYYMPKVILGFMMFLLFFMLLMRGRLKYLSKIQSSIKSVSNIDEYDVLPIRYKNELSSIAEEVNTVAALLKERRDSEKEFLLNISHDLRTPLNSIAGFTKLIQTDKNISEEQRGKYLSYVQDKCDYLSMLLNQFFQFARIKWSGTELEKSEINIQEFISQVFLGYLPDLKKKSLDFEFDFDTNPIYILVDVQLFLRAIHNIVSNAIKFTKQNTNIMANIKHNKDSIIIGIWNIPNDDVSNIDTQKLFDRFYKNDNARTKEGAGLGLSIAKEIIQMHGGEISAHIKDDSLGIIIELK